MFTCPSEKKRLMLCAVPTLFNLPDSQPEIKPGRVRKILATRKPLEGNSSQSDNFSDVIIGHNVRAQTNRKQTTFKFVCFSRQFLCLLFCMIVFS